MNISKAQIAALVLGYLKSEKLYSVVEEFIRCCSYFEENHQNIKMGKYFVTRIAGMSLIEFLEQYAVIYSIVQSRLEETDFYDLYNRTTLVEQLLYLLDHEVTNVATSTPLASGTSEVDTTPAHSLPGNSRFPESDVLIPKTPKTRHTRSRSRDRDASVDVTEVLTQSLLENHELHEKIAQTINSVINTPEVGHTMVNENISAGASKEIDAVIKTVIQRAEEDPVYNKLIDEIIGTTTFENPPNKKTIPFSTPTSSLTTEELTKSNSNVEPTKSATQASNNGADPMDDHNDVAIRSIIEASQNADPPPSLPPPSEPESLNSSNKPETSGEVYVFDGSLDTYLKTSGATNPINSNAVYFNPGSLIVVPPAESVSKQYYIVNNNQPLLKMNSPTVLTEQEFMSMPTIIVNDEKASAQQASVPSKAKTKTVKRARTRRPKTGENLPILPKTTETVQTQLKTTEVKVSVTQAAASAETVAVAATATRQASHVRNLDFSTPSCRNETETKDGKKDPQTWDATLRRLVAECVDKSPSPKKKRQLLRKKKPKQADRVDEPEPEPVPVNDQGATESKEEKTIDVEDRERIGLVTPVKDIIPKTPGASMDTSGFHCTPFTEVLEEQLKGVDLNSITTPNIPITPGFSLTTGELLTTNQRLTDYSTSSSYYQPSDSEQNKLTMTQLIEECTRLENTPEGEDKDSNLKVLSDVAVEQVKVPEQEKTEIKKTNERLKKFNNSIIGKKNLSLIRHATSSTSESDSDSDLDTTIEHEDDDRTEACEETSAAAIKDIIDTVTVKSTLDEGKKHLLNHLEIVRKRTVDKIKKNEITKKPVRNNRKLPQKSKTTKLSQKRKSPKATKRKNSKKKETPTEETIDERAQNLVEGLAQRGIHLIPNKTPQKKIEIRELEEVPQDEDSLVFDKIIYDTFEIVTHRDRSSKKKNLKQYDVSLLKKSMSANVFIEGLNEEVTRVMRWTSCDCLLDVTKLQTTGLREQNVELTDSSIVGSSGEQSSDFPDGVKGGKKRKTKFSDEHNQHREKRNKVYESNINLLKDLDVDVFLDKVHGE